MNAMKDRKPEFRPGRKFYWTRESRNNVVIWHLRRKVGLHWFGVEVSASRYEIELDRRIAAWRLRDARTMLKGVS